MAYNGLNQHSELQKMHCKDNLDSLHPNVIHVSNHTVIILHNVSQKCPPFISCVMLLQCWLVLAMACVVCLSQVKSSIETAE